MKTIFKNSDRDIYFFILMFLLIVVLTSGKSDNAKSFFDAVESNEYNKVYALLSEDY